MKVNHRILSRCQYKATECHLLFTVISPIKAHLYIEWSLKSLWNWRRFQDWHHSLIGVNIFENAVCRMNSSVGKSSSNIMTHHYVTCCRHIFFPWLVPKISTVFPFYPHWHLPFHSSQISFFYLSFYVRMFIAEVLVFIAGDKVTRSLKGRHYRARV